MIRGHPNPHRSFDLIDEKTGQLLLHKHCPNVVREATYDGYAVDFRTRDRLIEVKRSSNQGGSAGTQKPHNPLGQILFYQSAHLDYYGELLEPVILIYGSQIDRYLTRSFQFCRQRFGVRLWVVSSFRDGILVDCDTGEVLSMSDV